MDNCSVVLVLVLLHWVSHDDQRYGCCYNRNGTLGPAVKVLINLCSYTNTLSLIWQHVDSMGESSVGRIPMKYTDSLIVMEMKKLQCPKHAIYILRGVSGFELT